MTALGVCLLQRLLFYPPKTLPPARALGQLAKPTGRSIKWRLSFFSTE
jgi:hypothetical protein